MNNFQIRLAAIPLWADGLSVAEIAARFGVTKGKVAGVITRHRKFFPPRKIGRSVKRRGQEDERHI